jgi:hypothetical protein
LGRKARADPPLTAEKARDSVSQTRIKPPLPQRIGIAVGAGIAAALLFAVTVKGTMLAMLLAYLAPLPIFIVTLGWGLDVGALAGVVAGLAAAAAIEPVSGALFVVTVALPAWILSFIAGPNRDSLFRASSNGAAARIPVGIIVAATAAIGFALGVAALLALIAYYGGYDNGIRGLAAEFTPDLKLAVDEVMALPAGFSVEEFAMLIVRISPAAVAISTLLMLCVNLYIAARSVQLSHRLDRPWPNLPESLVLPPALGAALIVAAAVCFILPAPAYQIAWIATGALGASYVLQGLAVLHALSRGLPARFALLAGLYVCSLITFRWSMPIIAVVGLLESLLSLRARRAAADAKPSLKP